MTDDCYSGLKSDFTSETPWTEPLTDINLFLYKHFPPTTTQAGSSAIHAAFVNPDVYSSLKQMVASLDQMIDSGHLSGGAKKIVARERSKVKLLRDISHALQDPYGPTAYQKMANLPDISWKLQDEWAVKLSNPNFFGKKYPIDTSGILPMLDQAVPPLMEEIKALKSFTTQYTGTDKSWFWKPENFNKQLEFFYGSELPEWWNWDAPLEAKQRWAVANRMIVDPKYDTKVGEQILEQLKNSPAFKSELPNWIVDPLIGPTPVNYQDIKAAINILEQTKGVMVKQPLAGTKFADINYHEIKGNKNYGPYVGKSTKEAVIDYLLKVQDKLDVGTIQVVKEAAPAPPTSNLSLGYLKHYGPVDLSPQEAEYLWSMLYDTKAPLQQAFEALGHTFEPEDIKELFWQPAQSIQLTMKPYVRKLLKEYLDALPAGTPKWTPPIHWGDYTTPHESLIKQILKPGQGGKDHFDIIEMLDSELDLYLKNVAGVYPDGLSTGTKKVIASSHANGNEPGWDDTLKWLDKFHPGANYKWIVPGDPWSTLPVPSKQKIAAGLVAPPPLEPTQNLLMYSMDAVDFIETAVKYQFPDQVAIIGHHSLSNMNGPTKNMLASKISSQWGVPAPTNQSLSIAGMDEWLEAYFQADFQKMYTMEINVAKPNHLKALIASDHPGKPNAPISKFASMHPGHKLVGTQPYLKPTHKAIADLSGLDQLNFVKELGWKDDLYFKANADELKQAILIHKSSGDQIYYDSYLQMLKDKYLDQPHLATTASVSTPPPAPKVDATKIFKVSTKTPPKQGTHPVFLLEDQFGDEWIFKPTTELFRSDTEDAALRISLR